VLTALMTPLGQKLVDSSLKEESELVVSSAWIDNRLLCNHDVNVAGLPGGTDINALAKVPREDLLQGNDLRVEAVNRLGAIAWVRGELQVRLATTTNESAYILGIEPIIYNRRAVVPRGDWKWIHHAGVRRPIDSLTSRWTTALSATAV